MQVKPPRMVIPWRGARASDMLGSMTNDTPDMGGQPDKPADVWRTVSPGFAARFAVEVSIALGALLVALVAGAIVLFDAEADVLALMAWLDKQTVWGPLVFTLAYTAFVVLVLPTLPLTLGAGFLFGLGQGTLLVVIADTVGAAVAFLIARHLLGGRLRRYAHRHPKFRVINDRFGREGWKVVLLTRMVPFFPFKLSNYFFGMAGYGLGGFVIGTFFGIIPITVANVYVGSLAADLALLGTPGVARSDVGWAIYGAGFVVALGTTIYLTRLARKALHDWESDAR